MLSQSSARPSAGQLARGRHTLTRPTDQFRLSIFYGNVLLQWRFNRFQHLPDALVETICEGNGARLTQIVSEDRGRFEHWQMNKMQLSPAFGDMVNSITSTHP
jgi:hypothetical protein